MVFFRTGILFLEKGNERAGLEHIWLRHGEDFQNLITNKGYGQVTDPNSTSAYIEKIMRLGHYATFGYEKRPNAKEGEYAILYQIDAGYYLQVAFGGNGFIVTSFPIYELDSNKVAIKWDY